MFTYKKLSFYKLVIIKITVVILFIKLPSTLEITSIIEAEILSTSGNYPFPPQLPIYSRPQMQQVLSKYKTIEIRLSAVGRIDYSSLQIKYLILTRARAAQTNLRMGI